eukprot:6175671-Pleurochrysis_carterae.AAC.2
MSWYIDLSCVVVIYSRVTDWSQLAIWDEIMACTSYKLSGACFVLSQALFAHLGRGKHTRLVAAFAGTGSGCLKIVWPVSRARLLALLRFFEHE